MSVLTEYFCLHRKFLIFNLVRRNLKLKYRQSVLGILWTVLVPAASALVYYAVFLHVMKVNIPNYFLYVISGILPWAFFSTSITIGMEAIVGNHSLLNKIPIPSHVFPFTEVITNFINLLLALPVVVFIFLIYGAPGGWSILIVPFFLALLFLQSYGFVLILSVLFVYFRDLRHLMSVVIQMWLYLTPILYQIEMLPEGARKWIWLNPLAYIFDGINSAVVFGVVNFERIIVSLTWSFIILVLGFVVSEGCRQNLVEGI